MLSDLVSFSCTGLNVMPNLRNFILMTNVAWALASALAQTATPPSIDPALLTKARSGDTAAQIEIAGQYTNAAGALQQDAPKLAAADYKEAAEWYRKAAEQGSIPGEMHLAACYRDGTGVARDMAQAAEWYRKAAEQGDVTAQATLGLLYSLGQGLPQSYVEAYYWLDLAAAVKGPKQDQYIANRQMVGTHITTDELAEVKDRVAEWLAVHPRPAGTE